MNGKASYGQDDETRLVALARGGDAGAFGALVERHQDKLYRFVLKSVRCPADARDLTQEALLQAYRCLASFNGASRFSTWLTGIAVNLTFNHARRASSGRFVEYKEEDMANLASPLDDPSQQHQQKAMLGMLSRAIDAMPDDMRKYMLLIGLEGHTYDEVAQLLEVPLGTVKSRMNRARQALREELARQGFFD
jgi:RNA polymerase sigma-70 factor (ECF subfamily)